MEVVFDRGVYLPELDLWLDSGRRKESGFISHAHSDHTARHLRPVLTPSTSLLLSEYFQKSSPIVLDYGEPLKRDRYTLTLYPAGHCLGSAQALVESRVTGERLLYSGDFKTRPSPVNEPLELVACDVLVMEATYGRPEYIFPPEEDVLRTAFATLRHWLARGERPVVQGWRLGKCQEVLHHLLTAGFDVAVEESAYRVCVTYQEGGVSFPGNFHCLDGQWPEGCVGVCPPGRKSSSALDRFRHKRVMELTGWAVGGGHHWGRRGDASLPYSDHADFNDLVAYVQQVQPKQVYTVNGFPDLAAHLRKMGYPAVHLDGKGQPVDVGHQMKLL
jgi:Cft2 family RNA processing exonuclease